MATFIVGGHAEKFIQLVLKINASTKSPVQHLPRWTALREKIQRVLFFDACNKSLVERLCDFKIFAISLLSSLVLYVHLIKLLSKLRPMPFSVLQQDHTMLLYQPTRRWFRVWPWS